MLCVLAGNETFKSLVLATRTAFLYQTFEERSQQTSYKLFRYKAAKDFIPFACNVLPCSIILRNLRKGQINFLLSHLIEYEASTKESD